MTETPLSLTPITPPLDAHDGTLYDLALTATSVLTVGADGLLKMWRLRDGAPGQILRGHTDEINALAVYGDHAYTASDDGTVRRWDWLKGEALPPLDGFDGHALSVAVNEKWVLAGADDGKLFIWNRINGGRPRIITAHDDVEVNAVALANDLAVTGGEDITFRVWDMATTTMRAENDDHNDAVYAVSIHGDKIISGAANGTLFVADLLTAKTEVELEAHNQAVLDAEWVGGVLLSAAYDGSVGVWDAASGAWLAVFPFDAPVWCVAVSMDHSRVAVGDEAGQLHLFAPSDGLRALLNG